MNIAPRHICLMLAALALILAIGSTANAQRRAQPTQAPAAAQSMPSAPQQPVTQERLPAPPTLPTEVNVISTPDADPKSRPEVRSELDLVAQQDMADAGILAAVFTGLQALLTAGGMWLLWKTLKATRAAVTEASAATVIAQKAMEVTREIGEAQTRAYISVVGVQFSVVPTTFYPRVAVVIKNSGNSPAKEVLISFKASLSRMPPNARTQANFAPSAKRGSGFGTDIRSGASETLNHLLTDFPLTDEERSDVSPQNPLLFETMMRIEFADVFGKVISEEHVWMTALSDLTKSEQMGRMPFSGLAMMSKLPGASGAPSGPVSTS